MASGQSKNSDSLGSRTSPSVEKPVRKGFVLSATVILLFAVVLAIKLKYSPKSPNQPVVLASKPAAASPVPKNLPISKSAVTRVAPPSAAVAQPFMTSPELMSASQLVDELTEIGNGPITAAQAERFQQDLKELIKRGAVSVSAIQTYLGQNIDVSYGDIQGGEQLGYRSLRASLIDALNQIGGPEAQAAMLAAMNTTAVPSELLQLAQDLDKQAPGQYHDQIMAGAQQTLDMAAAGQLGTNTEVGAAFRTVQNYGGNNGTTADAANSDPLAFYNAVQLANMTNGGGLPSLLQMEQNSTGASQTIATTMIAQMAGQNSDALNALSQMAQNGQIPQNEWVQLAPILGGAQYQMNSSGQDYQVVNDNNMTADEINRRIQMIQTLMSNVQPGTGGYKAMQQQVTTLNGQLGN